MKITCMKNDKGYNLIAENGKSMQISENTRNKLGDIDDFVKCVTRYGYDSDQVADYLRNNAEGEKVGITELNYFFQIAMFIYENNDDIVNFSYVHISNTELDEVYDYDENHKLHSFKEVPIYYVRFHEAGSVKEEDKIKENNILKYKYRRAAYSLKEKEKEPYKKSSKFFEGYLQVKKDLEKVLMSNRRVMVVTIPSSKTINNGKLPLDHLVQELVKNSTNLIDGTGVLKRNKDKPSAHETNNRKILGNMETMDVNSVKGDNVADSIVVIDDITTSGNSFIAADTLLKDKYNLPIINIAYGKTVHNFYDYITFEGRRDKGLIKAVISDVDNTIMRKLYSKEFKEKNPKKANRQREDVIKRDAETMEILKYFSTLSKMNPLKIGFISNRGQRQLDNIMYNIFHTQNHILPFEYIQKNDDEYYLSSDYVKSTSEGKGKNYYKPSSYSVRKMMRKMGVKEHDRVIGIGNQESDMIAYKNAGIEPVLLNWFNEDLEEHNKIPAVDYNQYGLVFNDPKEFEKWLLSNIEEVEDIEF